MVCCTIIALAIGAIVWVCRRVSLGLLSEPSAPLAWTLIDENTTKHTQSTFSVRNRCASFSHAFRGVASVTRHEHNMWIHIGAAVGISALGVALHIDLTAWRWIIASIGLVLFAETINTAIEALCDALHPQHDRKIGLVKDIASGAVLICAITAAGVGILTFAPYL